MNEPLTSKGSPERVSEPASAVPSERADRRAQSGAQARPKANHIQRLVPIRNIAVMISRHSLPRIVSDSDVIKPGNEHDQTQTQHGPSSVVIFLVDVDSG